MTEHLIDIRGLHAGYDDIAVVRDLDLNVGAGEVVALLGPNGAGKTTTLLTISGLLDTARRHGDGAGSNRSTATGRTASRAAAWPTSPRTARCSSTSPCRRTSASG